MQNKNTTKQYILLFHSLPESYSVEIDYHHPTGDAYKSNTNASFHNFFIGDLDNGHHFGFLYSYKESNDMNNSFELKIYEI